jgi:hypothetical protein
MTREFKKCDYSLTAPGTPEPSLRVSPTPRRQAVNVEAAKVVGRGPINVFTHVPTFPAPTSAMSRGRTSTRCILSRGWTSPRDRW